MPQKPLMKKLKAKKSKNPAKAQKNLRKVVPKEEKANLKDPHLNAIKKGNMSITKVINKNIESFVLNKAKIGFILESLLNGFLF